MKIYFLNLEKVKLIHVHQINAYAGLHGLRDQNLLESAINYPQATSDFPFSSFNSLSCSNLRVRYSLSIF